MAHYCFADRPGRIRIRLFLGAVSVTPPVLVEADGTVWISLRAVAKRLRARVESVKICAGWAVLGMRKCLPYPPARTAGGPYLVLRLGDAARATFEYLGLAYPAREAVPGSGGCADGCAEDAAHLKHADVARTVE